MDVVPRCHCAVHIAQFVILSITKYENALPANQRSESAGDNHQCQGRISPPQPRDNPTLDAAPSLDTVLFVFLERLHLLRIPFFASAVRHPMRRAAASLPDPPVIVEMPDAFRDRLKPRIDDPKP